MARILSDCQRAGFKLFLEEHPDGIPWRDIGNYKQTTVGSMYNQGWIAYNRVKDKWSISPDGITFWEEWNKRDLGRKHPNQNLSTKILDTPPVQRNKENESTTSKVSRSAKKSSAKPAGASHRGSVRRSSARAQG